MTQTATTVGGYLQSLPGERRVAMARVCSMIRRAARGVRESMRYGLAFYEMDGPVFAVESTPESLNFYYADASAIEGLPSNWPVLDTTRQRIVFKDLTCIPLDKVEILVRNSLKIRKTNPGAQYYTQAQVLEIWHLSEDAVAEAPTIVRINNHTKDE